MITSAQANNDDAKHDDLETGRSTSAETVRVRSELLAEKVKDLLHEGNVRRITVRNNEGHTIIEIPVTVGVVAAFVAPVLVAVAAIAALATSWEIEIDRAPARTVTTDPGGTSTVDASIA